MLIPIALAILLTFLVNPIVKKLQRLGLGRMLAVMVAVSAAGLVILLTGGLIVRQVSILVAELPQNTENIKAKVKALRQLGSGPLATQFEKMAEEISNDSSLPFTEPSPQQGETRKPAALEETVVAVPVILKSESTLWRGLTG